MRATEYPGSIRILMVAARAYPLIGGIETHVNETARRLADRGHRVDILTTDLEGTYPPDEMRGNVHICRKRAWPRRSDLRFSPGVYEAIRDGSWDIMHVQGYHKLVAPLAMLAAWRASLPYVVTFHSGGHSSRLRHALRGMQRRALRPLLARADQLIGVSQFEAQVFAQSLGVPEEKIVVVPNGSGLNAPDAPPAPGEQGNLIVSIGRLERYKGHHHAIEAMRHVLERRPGAQLRIVGEGPYEAKLRALVRDLGLESKVTIGSIAAQDRAGMANLIASAALVVLLSDYEAHPVVVLEALALGRPVLATRSSGFVEMIDQGLVRGLPVGSTPEATAAAIVESLESALPCQHVALPTWEECVDRLEAIYVRSLKSRRVPGEPRRPEAVGKPRPEEQSGVEAC